MREKVYTILNKLYGFLLTTSFFAGLLPVVPYVIAIIVGGTAGEAIAVLIYKQYYPWVIALASVSVLVGLVAMYVGKKQGLSVKKNNEKK